MPRSASLDISDIFTISGHQITEIYVKNRMTVHFQGMSKTLLFPQTIALYGAPTCSIGISPEGLYNRLNNAGRLILLNQNAIQFASAPFIRVGNKFSMLTTRDPSRVEGPDDVPALKNYYHPPVSQEAVSISLATPLAQMTYKLDKVTVTRRFICPLLSGDAQALFPIGVEEFQVKNTSKQVQHVTLVLPRPSLVWLQEKELKPTDQDTVYICSTPIYGHIHEEFSTDGLRGIVMGNRHCNDRMAIAVPQDRGIKIDIQPYFCLNRLKQDLLLNDDGTFYEKRPPIPNQDYGAAISLTFTLRPNAVKTIPLVIVLDFPVQRYIDGAEFERKYIRYFKDAKTRPVEMAKVGMKDYPRWLRRTLTIQNRIYDLIRKSPSYKTDKAGALRLTRLILNEFSFPLSNAAVWVEDQEGLERARFLECFDYAYIDPSDVDWYSMVLLVLFPKIELEICQRFIDSILAEDPTPRFYHHHASFVEARKHFRDYPEEYEGRSLTQIRDATKIKGSIAHDLGAMPKGHPLRNVSEYTWYNNNYWVDLFPKLAMRVLRNVKFLGDKQLLERNWETLKFGLEFLLTLDIDRDGIPEGNPNEVKNTFDNLALFGADSYDATHFLAGCKAMIRMAQMIGDKQAEERIKGYFDKAYASLERLWRDVQKPDGRRLQYYVTCHDHVTGRTNTDVWTNQLDAVWYMISIGEESFIPEDRVKKILKTIYQNNRTTMGWAMCRTEDGQAVESEQGQDVYTTSNYVLAQLLGYYGMVNESKEVYKAMEKVVFYYGNSLITPDNIRAEFEQEAGEDAPGPHYIVAAYPRPGAILTHLVLQHVKQLREKTGQTIIASRPLMTFVRNLTR
ncbi:MAG: GH116 family glycosyl hydrolase [Sedimentisphaerales bacterium]|nr:GH116 family glycosyl hydrolase [Sedimentisphaerales bacterium]